MKNFTSLRKYQTAHLHVSITKSLQILICFFGLMGGIAQAQSFRTVSAFTGSSSDFTASEKYSAAANSTDYYVTFDATYLYIGAFRTSGSFGGTDNFTVYIDTDPNSTPTSGTGTTSGQSYNSVTGTLPFTANYNVHVEQSYQEARSFGSSWASTIGSVTYFTSTTARETRIPWTSIGSPDAIYLTMWMGYGGGFFSNAPGTNLTAVANPTIVSYFGGFGVSSAGCYPINTVTTPITASYSGLSPVSSTNYGKITLTGGAIALNATTVVAPGGSLIISSGTSLSSQSGKTINMGSGTSITNNSGSATILANLSGTVNFNLSTNYTTGTSVAYVNGSSATTFPTTVTANLNAGVDFGTTSNSTINGTLSINSGGYVSTNATAYGSASTLIYNSGTTYAAGLEWTTNATSGAGVPQNVSVGGSGQTANTIISFGASSAYRQANGNVTIGNTVAGCGLTLGSSSGGDLKVGGNFTYSASGNFTSNNRALFMVAASGQQSLSTTAAIPYLIISGATNSVTLSTDLTVSAPNGGNAITFINSGTNFISINGKNLVIGTVGTACSTSGTCLVKGASTGTASTLTINGNSGTISLNVDNGGGNRFLNSLTINHPGVTLVSQATIESNLNLTSGTLVFSPTSATSLNINGAIAVTSGTIDASSSNATINLNGASAQTVPSGTFSSFSCYKLTINNAAGVSFNSSATVSNTLTLTTGAVTMGASTTFTVGGTISYTSGSINASASGVTFAFTNGSLITLNAAFFSGNVTNLTLNGAGGVTLSASLTVTGATTLSSGTLNIGANTLTLGGSLTVTSGNINASTASATVIFNGTAAQTIPAGSFTGTVYNLTISNTHASGVALSQSITTNASGTLLISSGSLFTISNGVVLTSAGALTVTGTLVVASSLSSIATNGGVSNGTLLLNSGTPTINGTLTVNGYFKNSGSTAFVFGVSPVISFANFSVYEIASSSVNVTPAPYFSSSIPSWASNSNIVVSNSNSGTAIFGSGATVGNVSITGAAANSYLVPATNGYNLTIAGSLTINNTTTTNRFYFIGTSLTTGITQTVTVTGNTNIQTNTQFISGGGTFTTCLFTFNFGGNFAAVTNGSSNTTVGLYTTGFSATTSQNVINFTGTTKTLSLVSQANAANGEFPGNVPVNITGSYSLYNNITSANSITVSGTGSLTFYDNASAAFVISSGSFTVADGATIVTNNTLGLNGSVTTSGTKTWGIATYQFDAPASAAATVTGAFMPATIANLTINNASGVTLTNASVTVNSTVLLSGGAINLNGKLINIASGGVLTRNSGSIASTGTNGIDGGTINFLGTGTVNGSAATTFYNLSVAGGTTLLNASPTVNGTLTINTNGFISTNSPFYGTSSTLFYNQSGSYNRSIEWVAGTTSSASAGYPNNVTIGSSTQAGAFNLMNSGTLQLGGNLTIGASSGSASSLTMNEASVPRALTVVGNLILNATGTLTLGNLVSSNAGDLYVKSDFTKSGTFTPNSRAVFFTGSSTQTITGATTFDYLIINNSLGASGGVTLATSSACVVNQTLTLTSGLLNTSNSALTIASTGSVSGGSTSTYINGSLRAILPASQTSAGTYSFPVGNGGVYLPLTLLNVTTGVTGPTMNITAVNAGSGGTADGTGISSISTTEYWSINTVAGNYTSGTVNITRQAALGSLNIISKATTLTGTYSLIGGSPSGTTISGVASPGTGSVTSGSTIYLAMAVTQSAPTITTVIPGTPTIAAATANTGYVGQTLAITGTNFINGFTSVTIGGVSASLVYNSSTSLSAVVPSTSITGTVVVTNTANSLSGSAAFTALGFITNANGDWATAGTWLGSSVPTAGSLVTIANTATLTTSVSNSPSLITINSGSSLAISGSGAITSSGGIVNNGTWTMTNGTFNIGASGLITNNSSTTLSGGSIAFAGAGTVNGSNALTFNNISITTGTLTLTTVPTINGTFTINGGSISAAPIYTASSTLTYAISYSRFNEWSATGIGTIGTTPGYPNNVTIAGTSITVDVSNGSNTARALSGALTINSGNTLTMSAMTGLLTASRVSIAGTLTLSSAGGGDLAVTGAGTGTSAAFYLNGGTFTPNGRALYLSASTGTQYIGNVTSTSAITIPYLVFSNVASTGARALQMGCPLIVSAPSGGNAITFSRGYSSGFITDYDFINLNGFALTIGTVGTNCSIAITNAGGTFGIIKGSSSTAPTSSLTFNGNSASLASMGSNLTIDNGSGNTNLNNLSINGVNFTLRGGGTTASAVSVGGGTSGSLSITNGSLIMAASTNLNILGSMSVSGGSVNGTTNTPTFTFSGTAAQTIPASFFTSNTCSNATISNTIGVSLSSALIVSSTLTSSASSIFRLAGFALTTEILSGSGSITTASGTPTMTVGASNGTSTFSGIISGAISLTKSGTGTLTLSGANTYTGTTTINAGSVTGGAANSFSSSSAVTLANTSGAILNTGGFAQAIGTLSGGGTTGGTITLGSAALTINNGSATTYAAVISGSGGSIIKQGSGTLTLTAQNTYTGSTTITAGVLQLNRTGGTTLPVGCAVALNGGGLTVSTAQTINAFSLTANSGTLTIASGITLTFSGTYISSSFTATISCASTATISFAGGSSVPSFPGSSVTLNNGASGQMGVLSVALASATNTMNISTTTNGIIVSALVLTQGVVLTSLTNPITVGGSVIGGSASSYVSGPLGLAISSTSTTYTFPIGYFNSGTATNQYRPATFKSPNAAANYFVTMKVVDGAWSRNPGDVSSGRLGARYYELIHSSLSSTFSGSYNIGLFNNGLTYSGTPVILNSNGIANGIAVNSNTTLTNASSLFTTTGGSGGTYITNNPNYPFSAGGFYFYYDTVALAERAIPLTVTGASAASKTYNGNNTATISGGTLVGVTGNDVVNLTQSGTFASANAGTWAITPSFSISGANASAYTLTQPTQANATISTAALTITADAVGKVYGNTLSTTTGSTAFTASALQNSETVGTVTITYGAAGAAGGAIGVYTNQVTPSAATGGTLTASNYNITYVSNTLTVICNTNTWTGATSTAWNVGSNWCSGTTPSSAADIILPTGITNQPLVVANTIVGALSIASDATLGLNGNTLTINGAVTGTGQLKSTATSSLVIAGSAGTIYFESANNTIKDLTLNSSATATLGSSLNITAGSTSGTVNIGSSATLTTGGFLTLKSDASGTAIVANSAGTISGDVSVERYIPAKAARYFSFLASPVTQSIFNGWQQQIYVTGSGTGGQTCGSTSSNGGTTDKYNSNWFDKSITNSPSMHIYNATAVNGSRWVSIANTNATNLAPGKGFRVNVRGDRTQGTCADQLNSVTPVAPIAVTLKATGAVGQGNVTVTLNSISSTLYSLVGNPYPSPIDFATLYAANTGNMYNSFWSLSPSNTGNYSTYSNGILSNNPSGYVSTGGNSSYLASGQAILVLAKSAANGGSGTISFTELAKTSGTIPNTAFFGTANNQLFRVAMTATDSSKLDEAVVRFNSNGSNAYNPNWDALSLSAGSQTLASLKAGTKLAIATRPDSLVIDTVKLSLSSVTADNFRLVFNDYQGIDSTKTIILRDKFLGVSHDVRANQVYNFTVTADTASKGSNRFEVIFTKVGNPLPVNFVSVRAAKTDGGVAVNWKVAQPINIATYNVERSIDGVNFTSFATIKATALNDYAVTDNQLPDENIIFYRIQSVEQNGTKRYSAIAQVRLNNKTEVVSIYPNPVKEVMNVTINSTENTAYTLRIVNLAGKEVMRKSEIDSKKFSMNVSHLAGGVYTVEFTNAKGEKSVIKMIKE